MPKATAGPGLKPPTGKLTLQFGSSAALRRSCSRSALPPSVAFSWTSTTRMLITSSNSSGSDVPVTTTLFPTMFTDPKFGLTIVGSTPFLWLREQRARLRGCGLVALELVHRESVPGHLLGLFVLLTDP